MASAADAVFKMCCLADTSLAEAELLDSGLARFLGSLQCCGKEAFLGRNCVWGALERLA